MAEIKDCCSCIYETRSTFTEPCVSCGFDFRNYTAKPEPKRKRKTNADIIRAMTDEELAKYLDGVCHDLWQMFVKDPQKMWLDWLREEVTDGKQS